METLAYGLGLLFLAGIIAMLLPSRKLSHDDREGIGILCALYNFYGHTLAEDQALEIWRSLKKDEKLLARTLLELACLDE